MNDELNDLAKAAAEGAAEGFGKSLPPVYNDALQPAAKQVGKALGTLTGVINVALSPLQAMVWGYSKIADWLGITLEEKLKNVPPEDIKTPDPAVAGPSIEALRFAAEDLNLRDMYANLIAKSMNKHRSQEAHPGFVEVIKNLSSNDAILFKYLGGLQICPLVDVTIAQPTGGSTPYQENVFIIPASLSSAIHGDYEYHAGINNLERLGLISIPFGKSYNMKEHYKDLKEQINSRTLPFDLKITITEKVLNLTPFGKLFLNVCVK
ncbi:MAG TPA: hypothetical protein DIT07_05075 [Sphingobacteriaceae bacterium]|nr:hypothetical protein [Sphingobacteriaceae bacterium]